MNEQAKDGDTNVHLRDPLAREIGDREKKRRWLAVIQPEFYEVLRCTAPKAFGVDSVVSVLDKKCPPIINLGLIKSRSCGMESG